MNKDRSILIADDEMVVCELLLDVLPENWTISICHTGTELQALISNCADLYDFAIVDVHMGQGNGPDVVHSCKDGGINIKVLHITGDTGFRNTPYVLYKPFTPEELKEKVVELLESGK